MIDGFHVRKVSIEADHIAICKFDSPDDEGYKKIKNSLLDVFEEGKKISVLVPAEVDRQVARDKRVKKFSLVFGVRRPQLKQDNLYYPRRSSVIERFKSTSYKHMFRMSVED